MTPGEFWPIASFSAVVVFAAGGVVERIRNNRFVSKDVCSQKHKAEDERWEETKKTLDYIREWIDGQAQHKK